MVEIIPKPTARVSLWLNILFYFSISLLLMVLLSVFTLTRFQKKANLEQQDLQQAISQQEKGIEDLEKEVLLYQRKLDDFALILNERRFPLNFFSLLEENCHPRVQFTGLNLNLIERKAGLSGTVESIPGLRQQILILEKVEEIEKVNLSNISLGKQGGASFSLSLSLAPELFK